MIYSLDQNDASLMILSHHILLFPVYSLLFLSLRLLVTHPLKKLFGYSGRVLRLILTASIRFTRGYLILLALSWSWVKIELSEG